MTDPEMRDPGLFKDYTASTYTHAIAMYLIPYIFILRAYMWKSLSGIDVRV